MPKLRIKIPLIIWQFIAKIVQVLQYTLFKIILLKFFNDKNYLKFNNSRAMGLIENYETNPVSSREVCPWNNPKKIPKNLK